MKNEDPIVIALVIAFLVLSLGIHEAAHAWVASLRGDDTAKKLGRMTLNPIPHIDPFMTIILPAILAMTGGIIFAGAKPVPVNYHNLRKPLRDMMLVALAGPVSNFLLAILFTLAEKILVHSFEMEAGALAPRVMRWAALWNMLLAVFNLIPIPPLDGSRVMAWLLPPSLRERYVSLESIGMLLVVVLVFSGALTPLIFDTLGQMAQAVDFLTGGKKW